MWEPVEQPEGGRGEILYRATLYEYDSESNKIREKSGLDKVGARQTPKRTHEIRFGYDALNRLVSVEDSHGARAEYRYNSLGRRTYESFRISGDVNRVIRYEHDALGNLTEKQEGIEERFQKSGGKKRTVWAVTRYEYDLNGNCVRKSGEKYQNEYTYDRMNRLVGAVQDGKEEKYAYDLVGNRLKKESVQGTESYHYNVKNQLTHIHNGENTLRYLYDKQGNLLEEQGKTRHKQYSYDAANRQVSIASSKEDGTIGKLLQSNRYDGEGLRYETEENGKIIHFLFDRGELAQENQEGEETSYVRGHSPIALNRGGKARNYFVQDEMGSTLFLLDQDHEIRKSYRYDAFGNLLEETGDIANRLMYTGQMYDGTAVQYYLRARFYNPAIGRFMQEDTYRGDGLNLYAYCANNPMMYYDPSGFAQLCINGKTASQLETYEEVQYHKRLSATPGEKSPLGTWIGPRGNGVFVPSDPRIQALLQQKGLQGITYQNGIPDFSMFMVEEIELFNMHGGDNGRDYNFAQADRIASSRNGLTQAQASSLYGIPYVWHECNDMKTMQLIPFDINDYFGHMGGVGEINLLFELFNPNQTGWYRNWKKK